MYELTFYIESGKPVIKKTFETLHALLVFVYQTKRDGFFIHITKHKKK